MEHRLTQVNFLNLDEAMREGRVEACRSFLEMVRESERRGLEYMIALLRFHYRQSEFAQTVAVYQDLMRLHPTDYNHRHVFFDCCSHLGWIDVAREAVGAMAAGCDETWAALFQAEMLYAMGLDDEAGAVTGPFQRQDHYSLVAQMNLCQAKMRSQGIMRGLGAYARCWTQPVARKVLYGADEGGDLGEYWHGQNPLPRRLVLRGRGGVGDTFQWMRYLPFMHAAGVELVGIDSRVGRIAFKPLTRRAEIDWARASLARWDGPHDERTLWTDPFALFTTFFPALGYADNPQGYLQTAPDDIADEHLHVIRAQANGRPTVAITWSSAESAFFASKSLTLEQIRPLLAMENIHWVICQRGLNRQLWVDTPEASSSTVLPTSLTFSQTGGILQGLDAVVTNCSSITHLSGGLGCKTFMLASAAADWRWESFPSSSPWYSQLCIVRQPELGDWDGALRRLQLALWSWISNTGAAQCSYQAAES